MVWVPEILAHVFRKVWHSGFRNPGRGVPGRDPALGEGHTPDPALLWWDLTCSVGRATHPAEAPSFQNAIEDGLRQIEVV